MTWAPSAVATPSSAGTRPARGWRRWLGVVRRADVAVIYVLIVLVASVFLAAQPPALLRSWVQQSSTNLLNMRERPLSVLLLSAFVVSPLSQLVLLLPALVAYATIQRWLGRAAAVIIGALGHVGATLFVMSMEITALYRHIAGFSIVVSPDIGVSYGLAAACGALIARVPRGRWRVGYTLLSLAVIVVQFVLLRDFSALGHAVAWAIGVSVGWLLLRASRPDSPDDWPTIDSPVDPETLLASGVSGARARRGG
jgi:hypothetical protein